MHEKDIKIFLEKGKHMFANHFITVFLLVILSRFSFHQILKFDSVYEDFL